MDEILRQLGDLFLGAVPTLLLFFALYVAYTLLVHKPMERVLEERRRRTLGAMEEAKAAIARADAKADEHEQRLREAKVSIYKAQEVRRQKVLEARAEALAQARKGAQARVDEARTLLKRDVAEAQAHLHAQGEMLAAEVARIVLKPAGLAAGGRP
jgi:F-type H+-transporting ATPase subunit b